MVVTGIDTEVTTSAFKPSLITHYYLISLRLHTLPHAFKFKILENNFIYPIRGGKSPVGIVAMR